MVTRAGLGGSLLVIPMLAMASASAQSPQIPPIDAPLTHIHFLVIDDPGNPLFGLHHFYANAKTVEAMASPSVYSQDVPFLGAGYDGTPHSSGDP